MADTAQIDAIFATGEARARAIAQPTILQQAKDAVGL